MTEGQGMKNYTIKDLVLMALFAALTGVLSFIYIPIPFSPVPVTAQTVSPMLAGVLLGPKKAAMSQLVYIFLGVVGLPIFAGFRSGPAVLFGESGGYLVGFVVGSYVIGLIYQLLNERCNSIISSTLSIITGGIFVVYFFGVLWLMFVLELGLNEAIMAGVVPYLIGDVFKVFGTVILVESLNTLKEKGIIFT
ncbi:biotin transporter BioY [Natranaerofaba carboxydovora]|uniref:biotin transporter BioY n=1 Tax=Natranaerofaba carboxydovora TaxID=2742683 RepID=UPI001F131850|nr:biotin transporter BioY [Natranaerofaba carboxydovora]UMZ74593.1 Biotin transporter BioY [Natranaerofaba carboxydovora]